MVLTRLCVALASLALNTMPEAWPGAVAEMVRVFQEDGGGVDGRARCLALLELLTVLPEEFQTSRLPQYRKGQVSLQAPLSPIFASTAGFPILNIFFKFLTLLLCPCIFRVLIVLYKIFFVVEMWKI